MRLFPNMTAMAPGDELDVQPMLKLALQAQRPDFAALSQDEPGTSSDPNAAAADRTRQGRGDLWGEDGCFIAFGTLLSNCVAAARSPEGGGHAHRRHQRPVREAARPRNDSQGGGNTARWW
jgi:1-deoxy-D-xylulose-5-phosphate synthase